MWKELRLFLTFSLKLFWSQKVTFAKGVNSYFSFVHCTLPKPHFYIYRDNVIPKSGCHSISKLTRILKTWASSNAINIKLFESIHNQEYLNRILIQIPSNTTQYLNQNIFQFEYGRFRIILNRFNYLIKTIKAEMA